MTIGKAIKGIMAVEDITFDDLANRCGYKTPSGVSGRVYGGDMKVETAVKILNAMGYRLVVVKDDARMPDSYVEIKENVNI